jgi:hypothetical protein
MGMVAKFGKEKERGPWLILVSHDDEYALGAGYLVGNKQVNMVRIL